MRGGGCPRGLDHGHRPEFTIIERVATEIRPDQGPAHLRLDGQTITLLAGLDETTPDLQPGPHLLEVEVVAGDHGPFKPPRDPDRVLHGQMRSAARVASWPLPAIAALGLVALAAREIRPGAVVVTVAVGLAGLLAPLAHTLPRAHTDGAWAAAVAGGVLAVAVVAAVAPGPLGVTAPPAVGASVVAGVAEEAFFRRALYGWLSRWGAATAIGASAAAFAAVHVPVYGWEVAPLNFAAGLLFGWQRWVTGSWSASAVTHAVANLLAWR